MESNPKAYNFIVSPTALVGIISLELFRVSMLTAKEMESAISSNGKSSVDKTEEINTAFSNIKHAIAKCEEGSFNWTMDEEKALRALIEETQEVMRQVWLSRFYANNRSSNGF